jgi:glycosyltransferase involved in cell wall biosynthesis
LTSIIIPYIDEQAYLAEAVHSARAQHLDEMELILVCNLPSLPDGYHPFPDQPDIKFIHEPTPGSAYARNAGLKAASGDWIQFLDVDDMILPDKIAHQSAKAKSGAVVSPHLFKSLDGTITPSKWMPEDIWCGILDSGLGSTSSMLWHRDTLIRLGGWSTTYHSHQEYELLFRMAAAGQPITCVDQRETIVRERSSGSITLQTQPIRAMEGIQLRETIWKYLLEHGLDTLERKNAFLQYIFRQLRGLYKLDRKAAMTIYLKYFTNEHFLPARIGIPFYTFLYHGFGFNMTERIFSTYSAVRDNFLPMLPKNR